MRVFQGVLFGLTNNWINTITLANFDSQDDVTDILSAGIYGLTLNNTTQGFINYFLMKQFGFQNMVIINCAIEAVLIAINYILLHSEQSVMDSPSSLTETFLDSNE